MASVQDRLSNLAAIPVPSGSGAPTGVRPPNPTGLPGAGGATDQAAGGAESETRMHMYKSKSRIEEAQFKRASEQLTRQKEKRYDFMNHVRRLTDLFVDNEDEEEEVRWLDQQKQMGDNQTDKAMEFIEERRKKRDERKAEVWRFKNQLMHSEWLLDKPEDFQEKWVMVPIPQGKRNLIIASGGQTSAYSKNGMCISRFSSNLPGGGRHKHKWNLESSILDCVFNEQTKTYYILDMMLWRQTPMYDTETQFRFYWMHEKFLEVPEVAKVSKQNPYRFEPLPNFRCEKENIMNVLSCDMSVPMDGLLFYHKEGHYNFGFTPLVLWIRPHMIPEALGIMVPQKYIDRAPPDYHGFQKHREQMLKNMEARDDLDWKKMNKKKDRARERKEEKLKTTGKEVPAIGKTFVSSGTLASTSSTANPHKHDSMET